MKLEDLKAHSKIIACPHTMGEPYRKSQEISEDHFPAFVELLEAVKGLGEDFHHENCASMSDGSFPENCDCVCKKVHEAIRKVEAI